MTTTLEAPALARRGDTPTDGTVEGRARIHAALQKVIHPARINPAVAAAGILSWVVFALVCAFVPDSPLLPERDAGFVEAANPFTIVAALAVAAAWGVLWVVAGSAGRPGGGQSPSGD